jgi:sarcosine oxidase subunit beta
LIIAKDDDDIKQLREYHDHFNKLGVDDVELSPEEIHNKWPYIKTESIVGGFYSKDEANAHPFGVVWAYLESIKKMKGIVEKQNTVTKIEKSVKGFKITAEKGEYEAENIVIACAAHTSQLTEQLGHSIPMTPLRKEVLISEPVRPFFGPTIERLSTHFQVTQTMRGEIMGTIGWMDPGYDIISTTSEFLYNFADEIVPMIPVLENLNIIRQWTGICDKTPDEKPAIGELEDGLYTLCGFHDYGLTMTPIVGKLLAESIITGTTHNLIKPFNPNRFN